MMGKGRINGFKIVKFPKDISDGTRDAIVELWKDVSWKVKDLENLKDGNQMFIL